MAEHAPQKRILPAVTVGNRSPTDTLCIERIKFSFCGYAKNNEILHNNLNGHSGVAVLQAGEIIAGTMNARFYRTHIRQNLSSLAGCPEKL